MEKTYSELLNNPNWHKKAKMIKERDNNTCQMCNARNVTLHAHHKYYHKGKKPWEYKNKALITLCEECHKKEHEKRSLNSFFSPPPKTKKEKKLERKKKLTKTKKKLPKDAYMSSNGKYFLY